jgi:hypothetical protein
VGSGAPAHEDEEREQQQAGNAKQPHARECEQRVDARDARLRLQRLAKELREHLERGRDLLVDARDARILEVRHAP